jgi:plasmid maintenance system antidote protein VapI
MEVDSHMADRLGWRIAEFAQALGISRSKGYEIVASYPEIAFKLGASTRVSPERAKALVDRLLQERTESLQA